MKTSMIVAKSRDVQEVVSKLSSDKAKTREEGIKLLSTWLEGEGSFSFCKLIGRKTAILNQGDIPHSETWPFLVKLLITCIKLEISTSKKRPPKLLLAKMLRTIVQHAEDIRFSGKRLLLLSVVKLLFNHILDVVKDSTVYQSEYNVILRHLLSVKEYCCQMRKRIYCSLVLIYMKNVELAMDKKGQFLFNGKEDVFRNVLTLHVLLENSPGDFPDNLRGDVVKGFIGIFSNMREEGKVSRNLMECINTYLLKDGPNIGSQAMDIHRSLQDFVFHCWLTTHDKGLKNCLINYAKLQLRLNRISEDGIIIEQLLLVFDKELNQNIIGTIGIPKCDTVKDDKACILGSLHMGLMELAASVYYQACSKKVRASNKLKRLRRDDPSNILKDGITEGKWLWCGSFYFLLHYYGSKIDAALLSNWFEGISGSFERVLTYSSSAHSYDGVIWLLRGLTVLLSVIPKINLDASQDLSFIHDKGIVGWLVIWNSLMHALPVFSNVSQVVDAAMIFLGSMISKEIIIVPIIPRDVWELPIFKDMPSPCALYFISCYFSRGGIQSDLGDAFVLRKNLLIASLSWLTISKDTFVLNEQLVILLPAAVTSLSSGSCPYSYNDLLHVVDVVDHKSMEVECYEDCVFGVSDYSLEVLAEVSNRNSKKVIIKDALKSVKIPQEMRKLLISETEEIILQNLHSFMEADNLDLPYMILLCSFSCNCLYSLNTVWLGEKRPFICQMLHHISKLLCRVTSFVEGRRDKIRTSSIFGTDTLFEATFFTMSSFRSLMKCPLFSISENIKFIEQESPLIKCLKKLLFAFVSLFKDVSCHSSNIDLVDTIPLSQSSLSDMDIHRQLVDIELDTDNGSNDTDGLALTDNKSPPSLSFSTRWKLDMINTISLFLSVMPVITCESLFDIYHHESDCKVLESIIFHLCNSFSGDTSIILKLVISIENMIENGFSCIQLFSSVKYLLGNLVSFSDLKEDNTKETKEILQRVSDMVIKHADFGLSDWCARVKLIECACHFVELCPCIGQAMIPRILPMLHDSDYRVRLRLARQIGVLFQSWDGHDEIFQDVCSNIGFELVTTSNGRVVKAHEALSSSRSELFIETTIIALAHIAIYSEQLEFEIIFMLCVVAATELSQRDLIHAILNNFAAFLKYSSRTEFLAELMWPILYRWVVCEVSLMSLVEIREFFLESADPKIFLSFCYPWLLPSLIVHKDFHNLNLVSRMTAQPLSCLVRSYFAEIFSFCIAFHCQNCCDNSKELIGKVVLNVSFMQFAEISEHERDNLIKRHLVSIVSHLLSLSSAFCLPVIPFFTQEALGLSLEIVVDGFLEIQSKSLNGALVDKLNVFRGDRVFKFLLETHYQITRAVHTRHRCHRLSSIQVLLGVIGRRAILPSTSCYIFNLVGQFIGDCALQEQCCNILSTLLTIFKSNITNDVIIVLGKQLQFIVSKLVACYLPSSDNKEKNQHPSSRVLDLLHQLTVDADPSLYAFMKELEPFPKYDCFETIQNFLDEIINLPYSPREHFLQLVKQSSNLSRKSLCWSLQLIRKKLSLWNSDESVDTVIKTPFEIDAWEQDPEFVSAIWNFAEICNNEKMTDSIEVVADLIARVGLGDPYSAVFRLPGESNKKHYGQLTGDSMSNKTVDSSHCGLSEEDMIILLRLLKKCVNSECVTAVDVASHALQGILSTERGHIALQHLDDYERSLLTVHSKGVGDNRVEILINDSKQKCNAINRNDFTVWTTQAKTYKMWICPLVHSLLCYTNDIILILCHDVVLQTDEIAEFLFPFLLLNIAMTNEIHGDICHLISEKVEKNILVEDNDLIKSVQVILHALNKLRSYSVIEMSCIPSTPHKYGRATSSPKIRYALEKSKHHTWKKVYWLSIDYLLVAKAAHRCGSFFTAVMYAEYWCEEHYSRLTLGSPNYFNLDLLEPHIELLIGAITQINEPDSIYGIIQTHKLTSQIVTYEHEEKWSKALEYYDLLVRTSETRHWNGSSGDKTSYYSLSKANEIDTWKSNKGLMRSLQKIGCMHVLNVYCQGLGGRKYPFQEDPEFSELQYEAAWRSGNWDFSLISSENNPSDCCYFKIIHFNENLHSCLKAFQEGDCVEFSSKIKDLKKELMLSLSNVSHESTRYIHSTIVKIQTLEHLSVAWGLRWPSISYNNYSFSSKFRNYPEPTLPSIVQMRQLNEDWSLLLKKMQLNLNLLEPFIAFRNILLGILNCKECRSQHLLQSASVLRKGLRFSPAVAALHEFKLLCNETDQQETSYLRSLGRIEEARVLWGQGQHELAINLAKYMLTNCQLEGEASNVYRLVGKWFAETHSSNSRIILEQYLKRSVELSEQNKTLDKKSLSRQCQTYFNLAHYSDSLFKSYEERLSSSEWQAAMRLRRHKAKELDTLLKRLKSSTKGEKNEFSIKILELQKQLSMDKDEDKKIQDDRDNFLCLALEGYQRCLIIGSKYDIRVVFRLVSLWFSLSSRTSVIKSMLTTVEAVQSYKFIPLVYQIASRMGSCSKDVNESVSFQAVLVSLVKKMAIDHPYHTIYQLLALANGDRVKNKQRSRNSFIVDLDKKQAAENLLNELSTYHGPIIRQMNQMVEAYIKLAELETKKEETNKRMQLPREIRSLKQLELVPVVTASIAVDPSCAYKEGSFPHFNHFADSIMIMNGINAPKVLECVGSDGHKYRQLAKSGNDDLRQDAVMEQFFGLVNTFLQSHRDTCKRKMNIRTYKVVPFTPSAGVLEWVDGTIPLGEYLLGSTRNGGAHGRYGIGDWSFLQCREHMASGKDKRKAFKKVCENFRPVMHNFFLEKFLQPADWFEKRLSYSRSVAASSMVGYIVGLGDRHSMNILIDQITAEVVHIDLGVAFEQGLMLKTPERVPFRLTRDMIDGMGVTGVEGVFRRCCEETISVMRANKEALLTIVEVFIYDPLYKWALSPLKALQRQKETCIVTSSLENSQDVFEGNKDAARALLRVKQKLDGYEDGEIRSVQGQVTQLIQDAIDTERLCEMFPGWGAWL